MSEQQPPRNEQGGPATANTPHSAPVTQDTVLLALDGSPAAATALPAARAVAAQLGARVQVLHIVAAPVPDAELRQRLGLDGMDLAGIEVRQQVAGPAAGILAAAAEPDVALVVLTTHGRTIEPGRHLGHVAEAVIAGTTRPILLVRPEAVRHDAQYGRSEQRPFTRLLVPLDGTPTTAAALRPATELAGRLRASLDLLYVAAPSRGVPPEPGSIGAPCYVDQPQHEWPQWSDEVIARLGEYCAACPPDVPVRMYLAHDGDVGAIIARFATEHNDDAIVLVRRSHLEPGRAVVLRAVLDQTPCPILLVGAAHNEQRAASNKPG